MTLPIGFPPSDVAVIDPVSLSFSTPWRVFLNTIWQRQGGGVGNNSDNFNYPATAGNSGQLLTSAGAGKATTWSSAASKLSQFANDTGFVTEADVTSLLTQAAPVIVRANATLNGFGTYIVRPTAKQPVSILLPATPTGFGTVLIKDGAGTANLYNLVINAGGTHTIDGQTSYTIKIAYAFVSLYWDGGFWNITGN